MLNDSEKFAIVLMLIMIMYIWLRSRDNAHKTISDYFNNRQIDDQTIDETNLEDGQDDELMKFSMSGEKSTLLLSAVHNEADWITFKVFIMAIFFMVCLQIFGFAVKSLGAVNIDDIDTIDGAANLKESFGNFKSKFDNFGKKMMSGSDRTFTHMFVNEDTLGNKEIFDIIYKFAMSFKLMILSFIFMYGFNYTYTYFIVKDDEHVTEDALHMHTDIIMFVVLIILIYLLFYMVVSCTNC